MKYTIMCYHDLDTDKFNPPMFFPFDFDSAIETIKEGIIKGKVEGAESFEIMHLGYYDTASGIFELLAKPQLVLKCADYVRSKA